MNREELIRLVTRAQKNDKDAMDRLFTEFYNDVYYFALKTLKDSDLACDITQETFLEILRTIGDLKEPAAFVTWMKQITYHQCTRYFAKKKEVLVEEDEDGNTVFDTLADESEGSIPQEVLEKEEFRRTVLEMIDRLTEEQRSAVLLYYFDELSVGQIAKIQTVSEGTVKSRLNYARKAIRKSVEDYEQKNGIRLHSFALLPLLLLLLPKAKMPAGKAAAARSALAGAAKSAAKTGGLLAKLSRIPLAGKVVAGVTAAALAVGVGVAAVQMSAKPDTDRSRKETAAAQQVQAGQYQSSLLHVYPGSEMYSDVFVEYADFNCAYIHTTDGRLVNLRSSSTDWEAETRWPEAVRWDIVGITPIFYDAQGVLHAVVFQEAIACPDIRGQIVEISGSWMVDGNGNVKEIFANVLSMDDSGCVWETRYSASGMEEQGVFFCDVDTMEQFDSPEQLVGTARVGEGWILRSVINGVVYESTSREPVDSSVLAYREGSYPVYVENTGIQFSDMLSGLDMPYMIWRGETKDVIYKDGAPIAMPEGRSADEIVFALGGRMDLIVFGDGAVYVNGLGEGLQYSEELTGLYREDKIRQTDMVGDLVLLVLDDNVTYMVVGGVPANPPAEEEQTQPPVEEAVPALPDSLDDITFTIGGQEFRLGMKLGELIDAGVLSDIKYYDETVEPLERSGISGKLVSGGSGSVMIYAWNLTRQEADIRDTTIVGITCNMENWTGAEKAQMGSVCLNGVPINTSVDHLTQIFGKANVHEKTYETDTERSGGWRGFDIADTYRLYITATESLDGGLQTFALEVKIISVDLIP